MDEDEYIENMLVEYGVEEEDIEGVTLEDYDLSALPTLDEQPDWMNNEIF